MRISSFKLMPKAMAVCLFVYVCISVCACIHRHTNKRNEHFNEQLLFPITVINTLLF